MKEAEWIIESPAVTDKGGWEVLMCFTLPHEGFPSWQLSCSLKSQEVQECKKRHGHGYHPDKSWTRLGLSLFFTLLFMKVSSVCILRSNWIQTITSVSIKENFYLICLVLKFFKSFFFTKLCTSFLSILTLCILWYVFWRHCYMHDRNYIIYMCSPLW